MKRENNYLKEKKTPSSWIPVAIPDCSYESLEQWTIRGILRGPLVLRSALENFVTFNGTMFNLSCKAMSRALVLRGIAWGTFSRTNTMQLINWWWPMRDETWRTSRCVCFDKLKEFCSKICFNIITHSLLQRSPGLNTCTVASNVIEYDDCVC